MVKAADLRKMATKVVDRRNLIPMEIRRLEELLIRRAQTGETDCLFYVEGTEEKDPVYAAVVTYCIENGFTFNVSSIEPPEHRYDQDWQTCFKIFWHSAEEL